MTPPSNGCETANPAASRSYGAPMTERIGIPHLDAKEITPELIREVVVEFYERARHEELLGPVFDRHIHDWDAHLDRMTDFWGTALLRSGRYSGRPVEHHRAIEGLSAAHFQRWIELFEVVVHDLCTSRQADAFVIRARRMREGMTKVLQLEDPAFVTS